MSASKAILPLLASLALTPAAMAAQAATPAVPSAAVPAAEAPVRTAVAEFVNALNALDAERLGRTFADDITVFFPGPPFPAARVQGRAAVQGAFGQLFAALRQRGTRNATLQPRALDVQLYGDMAVASFHLTGVQQREVGRRTLVLRRIGGRWLIVHMHASVAPMLNPPTPAPARPTQSPPPPRR